MKNNLILLREIAQELEHYNYLDDMLIMDSVTMLPPKGVKYREKLKAFLSYKKKDLILSKRLTELLNYFEENIPENHIDRAIVNYLKWLNEISSMVPAELESRLKITTTRGVFLWEEAVRKSDFKILQPQLEKIFEICKEIAENIGYTKKPIEALMKKNERNLDFDEADRIITEVGKESSILLRKIRESGKDFSDEILNLEYDKKALLQFAKYIAEKMGYDFEAGGMYESYQPLGVGFGVSDARVSIDCRDFDSAIFGTIHEIGHGMYEQKSGESLGGTCLYGGNKGLAHEGFARFHENVIAKSESFWQYFFPVAQGILPQLRGIEADEFIRAVNRVKYDSPNRVSADEITYNIHIVIRHEIEKEILNGEIKVKDAPEVWNSKYKEYLGFIPKSDKEGILQDIHWSMGEIGYFWTYLVGNVYYGQLSNKLVNNVPNLSNQIRNGNFKELNSWMWNNLQQYGRLYTTGELLEKITGEKIQSKYYISYLNDKFKKLYEI